MYSYSFHKEPTDIISYYISKNHVLYVPHICNVYHIFETDL